MLAGIVYALFSPVEYRSTAEVLPQQGEINQSGLGNLLKNFGGVLGIDNIQSIASKNQNISPQVYPEILKSLNFQYAMMQDTVYLVNRQHAMSIYQYLEPHSHFYSNWFRSESTLKDMSRLPDTLRKQLAARQINHITPKEQKVIQSLRNRITIEFVTGGGVMKVTARMPDPVAAAQVCHKAIKRLTKYIREYQTQKAMNVLDFTNKQYELSRQRFRNAQQRLAKFKDQHINLSTAKALSQEKYLQSEYNLAFSVYNSIAQNRIQARMNLQKNVPVFKTVQSAEIPLHRSSPLWIPIILISFAVGLVLSFIVVAGIFITQKWYAT